MTEAHRVPIASPEVQASAATGSQSKPPRGSSRTAIFFIQIAYLVALGAFVLSYRVHWIEPRRDFFGPVPFLVPWFGALGAVVLSLSGVFDHRGRDWNPEYCFWHWSRLLIGGIVGTISVLVFQSGLLAVGSELPSQTATTTTKNLLYYVVAFVVGYREDIFRQLIKRLADVILTPPAEAGAAPVIESVEPPESEAGQQADVKVSGSGFTGTTSVKLGGESLQFVGESDTQLTVTIPAEAETGRSSLVVTTKHGSATAPFTIA